MSGGFRPMLASTKRLAEVPAGWAAEPKLDGWRAIVAVDGQRVTVRSRRGNDLTDLLPELQALSCWLPPDTVLDGELIASSGRASDFYALGPRLRARTPAAVHRWSHVAISFAVFDLLQHDGHNLCPTAWSERRAGLEALQLGDSCMVVPTLDGTLADVLAACGELDLEGVVLKRRASLYRPGERSKDWIKVKTPDWRERHGTRRREQ